jgi:succinate-acetate transporter protein
VAEPHQDPTKERTSVVESGVADPAPLGLAAFALTTFAFSIANAGLVGEAAINHFVPLALIYGGLAQFIAGMWEFRNQNTFASTGFTSYGAFWIALGILEIFARQLGIAEEQVPVALAWTFTAWAIFTLYMWIGSWGVNAALGIVFTLLLATFILLAATEFTQSMGLHQIAGWVGIVTAASAWYVSAADVLNDTYGRTILPVGPAAGGGS